LFGLKIGSECVFAVRLAAAHVLRLTVGRLHDRKQHLMPIHRTPSSPVAQMPTAAQAMPSRKRRQLASAVLRVSRP
jgi:hypothetical protein